MNQNVDLVEVILDFVFISGSLVLVFVPLDKKRIRECWAKSLFVIGGLVGITTHVIKFMLDCHWLTLIWKTDYAVYKFIWYGNGLLLGFLFALIFSGQLIGIKPQEKEST